jgi:hypothetical protein
MTIAQVIPPEWALSELAIKAQMRARCTRVALRAIGGPGKRIQTATVQLGEDGPLQIGSQ